MKSSVIKHVVISAKQIIHSGDRELISETNQQLITEISRHLNAEFHTSPRTVSAIIRYIVDQGYDLKLHSCDETRLCLERTEKTLKEIDPMSMRSIDQICRSMFAQYTGKP